MTRSKAGSRARRRISLSYLDLICLARLVAALSIRLPAERTAPALKFTQKRNASRDISELKREESRL
jgi:hypothetical protein